MTVLQHVWWSVLMPAPVWWALTIAAVWGAWRVADRCGWLPPADD